MEQIEIRNEALPILKSSIALKQKLLKSKSESYRKRLKVFEKKYKMKSDHFIKAFNAGKLGDDEEWFDWLFLYEAYNKVTEQEKIIEGFSL